MKKKPILITLGIVVVVAVVVMNLRSNRGSRTEVQVSEVKRRDVAKIITASGSIRPRRQVNVSAAAIGKVTRVAVEEGDYVNRGDFLLQIDPAPFQSAVDQLAAAVRGASATLEVERATLKKVEYELERARQLNQKGFLSEDDLRDANVAVEINRAKVKAAGENLSQYRASLGKARHELDELHVTAEMSGVISALNVEEGESAIMGTINNPGTVLLSIADLTEIEVAVKVDETEVVFVRVGQKVEVRVDAYPDSSFSGVVTEVGNSAMRSQLGLGQESVDFKVIIAIQDSIPNVRPGLSASVDIVVAEVDDALTVPIQCLTVRDPSKMKRGKRRSTEEEEKEEETEKEEKKDRDIEGVFIVDGDVVTFKEVEVGIAGESHFEVVSGLAEGDKVVSGPFKAITDLRDGDPVKVKADRKKRRSS